MTSPVPTAITSDGNVKVQFVTTIADPANPTVTECTAVSSFDASCYFTDDGWAPTTTENVVTDARLCSRQVFEDIGTTTDQLVIKYIYRQQEPTSPTNKAFSQFKRGSSGYFVVRQGTAFEPDIAAGDIVDVFPVTFDTQQKQTGAKNEKQKIMQNIRITNTTNRDVVVVS